MSTRNTSGLRCARSYRTLRDGSFEGRFPRHFVPGYDRCGPSGTRWQTFRNSIEVVRFSNMERDQIPGPVLNRRPIFLLSLRDTSLSVEMSKLQGKAGRLTYVGKPS